MKCVMIDNNEDYVTKSKLTIAVKALAKYNDKSRVAVKQTNKQTNKQTQRHRNWQTLRHRSILTEQKDILTNRRTSRLIVDIRTQRGKQKMINEAFCSAVIEINK